MRKRWRLWVGIGVVAIVAFVLIAAINANRSGELAYDFLRKAQMVRMQRGTGVETLTRTFEIKADLKAYAASAKKELLADGWRLWDETERSLHFVRDRSPKGDYQLMYLTISPGRPQIPGRSEEINLDTENYLMVYINEGPRVAKGGFGALLARWFGI